MFVSSQIVGVWWTDPAPSLEALKALSKYSIQQHTCQLGEIPVISANRDEGLELSVLQNHTTVLKALIKFLSMSIFGHAKTQNK